MNELLELLGALKSNAERERTALKALDSRALLELATQADGLALKLGAALQRVPPAQLKTPSWAVVRKQTTELKSLLHANAFIASRSLEVVRALQRDAQQDAPAFISRHA